MKCLGGLSKRANIPFAVCCLWALVGMAQAGDKAQLSGSWNFNPAQSDDAQQKVQQAQQAQQSGQRGAGGGGYPQGGYPAGGGYPGGGYPRGGYPGTGGPPAGGGYPGTGGYPGSSGPDRGGIGNVGSGVSGQEWAQLATNPKYLNITQHDDQIVISDSDHSRILYPDGKKHQARDENGQKISTKTEWQGNELITETRTWSGKLTETFRVSSDGKQLTVVSRFENSSLSVPLSIQRVYDLGQ